eukprot:15316353-Alexandrium_andersonii.AAC.1
MGHVTRTKVVGALPLTVWNGMEFFMAPGAWDNPTGCDAFVPAWSVRAVPEKDHPTMTVSKVEVPFTFRYQ